MHIAIALHDNSFEQAQKTLLSGAIQNCYGEKQKTKFITESLNLHFKDISFTHKTQTTPIVKKTFAYRFCHTESFPSTRINDKRILILQDELWAWTDKQIDIPLDGVV